MLELGPILLVAALLAGCGGSPAATKAPSETASPSASPDPTPTLTVSAMPTPTDVPTPSSSETVFPERPEWPGTPTMTAGSATVPGAGVGGCWSVFYQARGYAADSCGPGSFPLDATPTNVAAGAALAIAYAQGALVTDRTFSGEPAEFSVLASLVSSLRDLPVGQQEQLPSGGSTADLGGRIGSRGEVLATAPKTPGDYLIQVTGSVRVGAWSWAGPRFYYRLLVE